MGAQGKKSAGPCCDLRASFGRFGHADGGSGEEFNRNLVGSIEIAASLNAAPQS
jgi:hypothetical protein